MVSSSVDDSDDTRHARRTGSDSGVRSSFVRSKLTTPDITITDKIVVISASKNKQLVTYAVTALSAATLFFVLLVEQVPGQLQDREEESVDETTNGSRAEQPCGGQEIDPQGSHMA